MQTSEDGGDAALLPIVFFNREYIEGLAQSIVEINRTVLLDKGFSPTVEHGDFTQEQFERVLSVLYPVFIEMFGSSPCERYEDIFDQVSIFAEHLAKDHIFTDGNKRTTVKVSLALLLKNGIVLDLADSSDPEENEVYRWIASVVEGVKTREELADLLRKRAVF